LLCRQIAEQDSRDGKFKSALEAGAKQARERAETVSKHAAERMGPTGPILGEARVLISARAALDSACDSILLFFLFRLSRRNVKA
jgi:hypothetical protein